MRLTILTLVLALIPTTLSAQEDALPDGFDAEGIEEIEPDSSWLVWFDEAEACLGREADEQPTWFVYDYMDYVDGSSPKPVVGLYIPDERAILIQRSLSNEDWLVKHEIVHMILLDHDIGDEDGSDHQIHEPYLRLCAPKPIGYR